MGPRLFHEAIKPEKSYKILQNNRIIEQLGNIEDIPPLPATASRIIDTCFDEQTSFQEMATLIKQDPVLTARILILINSPGFALPTKIKDLSHAISLLGKKQIRNLALSVTIFDTFTAGGKKREREMAAFWQHCVACAYACEELAKELNYPHPEEAFIAGLLHDIGKLIAYHRLEKTFAQLLKQLKDPTDDNRREWPPLSLEKEILGAGHHLIGKWAAEAWNFPAPIIEAVWLHHQPPPGPRDVAPPLPLLVRFADAICNLYNLGSNYFINHELDYSTSAPYARTVESLKTFFRLDQEALLNVYHTTDSRLHEFDSCLEVVDNDLYFAAIRKANRELGRLNLEREKILAELSLKNRLLEGLAAIDRKQGSHPKEETLVNEILTQTLKLCQSKFAFCGLNANETGPTCWRGQFGDKKFSDKELVSDKALLIEKKNSRPQDHENNSRTKILTTLKRLILKKPDALLRNSRITPLKEHPAILVVPLCEASQTIETKIHGQLFVDCRCMGRNGINKIVLLETLSHFAAGISDLIERGRLTNHLAGQAETITELNRQSEEIQTELLQAHRLATVGRLAAGAAHEINNPLTVISGQLQILKTHAQKSGDSEENLKRFNKMLAKVDKIAHIVSDLLTYGRPQKARVQSVSVKNIIHQSIEAVKHRQGFANISFTFNLPDNLPTAMVDPQQLGQIFINLLINAQLAMSDSGSIGISAAHNRNRIEVNLSDTGCGIAPEHLPTIFDPFFTTRGPDSGSGLGLSIVHSLIDANHGSIEVQSTPNKGTTFTISLPAA
ncbi:MAG: HDOD domain-containing protein [Pseudomonadota bacterium]|nr:HDOD domain-containing protein [Pseudomonadota bacterium]